MMYDDMNLINLEKEGNKKMKAVKVITLKTNKSNLVKFARIQLLGILLLCIAIVIAVLIINKTNVQTIEVEKPVTVTETVTKTVEVPVEVEKIVEVEKPIEIEKIVEVEKPVTVTETVEVPVEVVKTVEVEKEVVKEVEKPVYIETVKTVEVVDNEAVQQLASEMAQQMYNVYKDMYTAQVNEEATQIAIDTRIAELQAEYTELMSTYIAQADAEKVTELATEMANTMFEQFQTEYITAKEAERIANVSVIKVLVYLPNYSDSFYLEMNGSLHDELTWEDIKAALYADERMSDEYKIKKIEHRDAVETFVGRDYSSTRIIHLQYK